MCKFPSLLFIVVIYHGILTLCIDSSSLTPTQLRPHTIYDTESCMFPYLIVRQFQH